MCNINLYILIFILGGFVRCADKQGDQPPFSSEVDSEEEDNFEVTETSEPSKTSETVEPSKPSNKVIFMKKNKDGVIVPMDEGDYKKVVEDPYKTKYVFKKNLEMILFDYKVIFEQVSGKPYATSLTHYKINVFTIEHENGFLFILYEKGRWRIHSREHSGYLKLYTKHKGKDVKLGEKDYFITFGPQGFLKYELKRNVKCCKVKFKKRIIWERKSNEPYPAKVSIDIKKDIILYFHDYFMIFLRKRGYKLLYKESRKK